MQRANVDLPQPDSPTTPSTSPRASSRSTPATACTTSGGWRRILRASVSAVTKCISIPRTASSGSDTGDHRLLTNRLGGSVGMDASAGTAALERQQRLVAGQAVVLGEAAAGGEAAAVRRRPQVGRATWNRIERLADVVGIGHRAQQRQRVGVAGLM